MNVSIVRKSECFPRCLYTETVAENFRTFDRAARGEFEVREK